MATSGGSDYTGRAMKQARRFAGSLVLVASIAALGCGPDKDTGKPLDAGAPDAATQPIVGGKLGAALASAAAAANSSAPAKGAAKGDDAPPENGIFGPGDADRRQAKDAPPKIEVISEGAEPRISFATKLDAPEQKVTVNVGIRINQGRLPGIDFALSIKPDKAKADKPKDGAAAAPATATPPGSVRFAATVAGTSVPPAAGIPKDFADAVAKLKGAVVRYDLSPTGAATNFSMEVPKDAGEGLEIVLDALVDAISMFTVPLPAKPIGKDGYWIASDRARTAAGIEVVRYRVFKIVGADDTGVTLSVDIRQYSADQKLKLDTGTGQKNEMGMDAFDSQGKGTVVWKTDTFLPARGDFSERVAARIALPQGAQQPGGRAPVVQTEVTGAVGGGAPAAPASSAAPEKKP